MTMTEAWCRTYTRLIPSDEADRRCQEIASHIHEAREHGVAPSRLCLETALGATADLRWSAAVRRRHGLTPLLLVPFVDATIGAIVAGALILMTLLWTIFGDDALDWPRLVLMYAALLLVASGHAAALVRRLRR